MNPLILPIIYPPTTNGAIGSYKLLICRKNKLLLGRVPDNSVFSVPEYHYGLTTDVAESHKKADSPL